MLNEILPSSTWNFCKFHAIGASFPEIRNDAMILHSTLAFIHDGSALWWREEFEARRQARPTNDFSCNTVRVKKTCTIYTHAKTRLEVGQRHNQIKTILAANSLPLIKKIHECISPTKKPSKKRTYIIALLKADEVEGSILP